MKLTTIKATGLVPVRTLKTTGMRLKGSVYGLPPRIAAAAIEAREVEPVEPADGAESEEVEVDLAGDVVDAKSADAPTPTKDAKPADPPKSPAASIQQPATPTKDAKPADPPKTGGGA